MSFAFWRFSVKHLPQILMISIFQGQKLSLITNYFKKHGPLSIWYQLKYLQKSNYKGPVHNYTNVRSRISLVHKVEQHLSAVVLGLTSDEFLNLRVLHVQLIRNISVPCGWQRIRFPWVTHSECLSKCCLFVYDILIWSPFRIKIIRLIVSRTAMNWK